MAHLQGSSLNPVEPFLERCTDGTAVTFDNIRLKVPGGDIRTIEGRSYSLYDPGVQTADDRLFSKVEVEAAFPGGDKGWRDYLIKNLIASTPVDEGWKAGTYTVIVQFIVHTDGTISDVTTTNYEKSKTAQHCISIIQNGPNWLPAVQNGVKVNAYRKQPITFLIEEQNDPKDAKIYSVPLKAHLMQDGEIKTYSLVSNGTFSLKAGQLVYLDGKICTNPSGISSASIRSMETYDEASGKKYFGDKGRYGVLLLNTRK